MLPPSYQSPDRLAQQSKRLRCLSFLEGTEMTRHEYRGAYHRQENGERFFVGLFVALSFTAMLLFMFFLLR